eukprot:GHVS01103138.1.p1 GENE.GHVS01103138.1~~GHVS01103138.1.p1  ORF type:complete len:116 (-),score=0.11 GHVS01103138.1:271-618(-)
MIRSEQKKSPDSSQCFSLRHTHQGTCHPREGVAASCNVTSFQGFSEDQRQELHCICALLPIIVARVHVQEKMEFRLQCSMAMPGRDPAWSRWLREWIRCTAGSWSGWPCRCSAGS